MWRILSGLKVKSMNEAKVGPDESYGCRKRILGRRIHAIYPCNDLKLEVAANGEETHTNKKELISQC